MASASMSLQFFLARAWASATGGAAAYSLLILAMMVLPLPPFMLDLFFTFNIAISVIVMLVAINVMKPLDFSVFPTVSAGHHPFAPVAQCCLNAVSFCSKGIPVRAPPAR
jgi:hypothetical protein